MLEVYKLVYHLGKIRTHWHTKKAEKDTHFSGTSLAFICSKLPPGNWRACLYVQCFTIICMPTMFLSQTLIVS